MHKNSVVAIVSFALVASSCARSANNSDGDSAAADTTIADTISALPTTAQDTTAGLDATKPTPPSQPAPQIPQPLSIPGPDTARGIVKVVGTGEVNTVILQSDTVALAIRGPAESMLRPLSGVEAVIYGRQTSDIDYTAAPRGAPRFVTDSFVVRAVDGRPAYDGVIEQNIGQFTLRLTDGGTRLPLVDMPEALRALVGARVFLVGPITGPPQAWGVIRR